MLTTCFSEIIISGGDSNQSTLVMPLVVVHSLISRLDQRPDQTRYQIDMLKFYRFWVAGVE